MDIRAAIKQVTLSEDLSSDEMIAVMGDIMSGGTTDAQNAAFLIGLQMKGVKAPEILGGATVMLLAKAVVPMCWKQPALI